MSDDRVEAEPLSDEEAEAAFVALVEILDGMGCVPVATIVSKEDEGFSVSLHFSVDRARKLIAAWNTRTLDPSIESLQAEVERLREAMEPFANCVEQISSDEDDEEWAKFRLLVKDYRRAASAMWPKRKGFARCPTCKGEFDDGEWEASSSCPECETPKAALAAKEQTR